ncbi:MAG TPA: bifunctional 5,10-methylenetetrahydrofolate dehydrogenase/5,10-methenyltetrahydrofolate cyclohydrolase [Candidatus Polarisedimenticolaceae bacterium]|nr:bifunctional 5,10-methylenetetrahydrofolate dehydrogenase/5,10-methenyltetrahydrofolate cyclohydrolase [Candidatus Polarisedimenticolaceae bacterium]
MSEARTLDGKATAREIRDEVAQGCAELKERHGVVPGLTVVLVGEDPASQIYVRNKAQAATEAGMRSHVERLPATTSEAELLSTIERLNRDPAVHGILVQLPLPKAITERRVIEAIDPDKDVDGFHPVNVGRLWTGLPGFCPCTPLGILELLRRHGIALAGQRAVVIGRSNIVGKPMASLLLREHCTVTVCHSRSQALAAIAAEADVLIAAVGKLALVTGEFIKPGAAVVDVGIHRVEDAATCRALFGDDPARLAALERNGSTLAGDVHPRQARERAGWLTPVPGGVGPLTIACLLKNTLQAAARAAES